MRMRPTNMVAIGLLALANLVFLAAPSQGSPTDDVGVIRTCVCVDGSGSEPEGPWDPQCWDWFQNNNCTDDDDCGCSEDGEPEPGGGS